MKKKAQAALEFLMTYGWAILVVLVVIGALAYFGVLNPSILLPEKCTMVAGLTCADYAVDSTNNNLKFTFVNGLGSGIYITRITVSDVSGNVFTNCDIYFDDTRNTSTINGFPSCVGPTTGVFSSNFPLKLGSAGDCYYNNVPGLHINNAESASINMTCWDYTQTISGTVIHVIVYLESSFGFSIEAFKGELLATDSAQ